MLRFTQHCYSLSPAKNWVHPVGCVWPSLMRPTWQELWKNIHASSAHLIWQLSLSNALCWRDGKFRSFPRHDYWRPFWNISCHCSFYTCVDPMDLICYMKSFNWCFLWFVWISCKFGFALVVRVVMSLQHTIWTNFVMSCSLCTNTCSSLFCFFSYV